MALRHAIMVRIAWCMLFFCWYVVFNPSWCSCCRDRKHKGQLVIKVSRWYSTKTVSHSLKKLQKVEERLHHLPRRVQHCSGQRRGTQGRYADQEVQYHPQQEDGEQVSVEEQGAPAAVTQHLPGIVRVQQPQEAQHPALVDQLGVVDVKNGGLGVSGLAALSLRHFSQPSYRNTVEE